MAPDPTDHEEGGEAGTTIVELLVGLALLALIALFVGDGIGSIRQMLPLAARIDAGTELTALREHLRRMVGETVADLSLNGGAPYLGEPERLRFLAPADPLLEIGGLNEITLALVPGEGGRLDFLEGRAIASGDLSREASRTVLVENVASLHFRYGEERADGTLEWRDSWVRRGAPPALVALALAFPPGDRRRFPELLVHPQASPAPPEGQGLTRPGDFGGLGAGSQP